MYPVFIELTNKPVVVIGGGVVSSRKVAKLLEQGAIVTVISPVFVDAFSSMKASAEEHLILVERTYAAGDLSGALLAICAVGIDSVNKQVMAEAHKNNTLLNVVDVPDKCDFYVPSIVERGPLSIAISTHGAAPTVAKEIRCDLESAYPPVWGDYLTLMAQIRPLVLQNVPGGEPAHKPIFEYLAQCDLFGRIQAGETLDAQEIYAEIVIPFLNGDE